MDDIMQMPVDQKMIGSLVSALIQQKIQEQDPMRMLQLEGLRSQTAERELERQRREAARSQFLQATGGGYSTQQPQSAGLPGDGPGGPDAPITYGRNPRTGTMTFNNLGWANAPGAELPVNQRLIAERYNSEAAAMPRPQAPQAPAPNPQQNLLRTLMAMQDAQLPTGAQNAILQSMFGKQLGMMTEREQAEQQAARDDKRARATQEAAELSANRQMVRDVMKTQAGGVDPKKLIAAQDAVAAAINAGLDPNATAQSFGFNFMQDAAGPARGIFSQLGLADRTTGGNVVLSPAGSPLQQLLRDSDSLPAAMQQALGMLPGGRAAPAQTERVVVTKGGKDFSLPASQLSEAEKQGYKLKR